MLYILSTMKVTVKRADTRDKKQNTFFDNISAFFALTPKTREGGHVSVAPVRVPKHHARPTNLVWTMALTPSPVVSQQVAHLRRSAPVAAPLRSTQAYAKRQQRICRGVGSAASSASSLLRAAGVDDGIDPLEAGPDSATVDAATPATAAVQEDDADAVAMAALASATAKKQAEKPMKKKRKRTDPFMPKGSVAPIMWHEFTDMPEGCRGTLVRGEGFCGRGLRVSS